MKKFALLFFAFILSFFVYAQDWNEINKILASDGAASDNFGSSASISGNYAIIGAYGDDDNGSYTGSAYIFYNNNGTWTQQQKLLALDGATYDIFGQSVSISGNYAIVAARGDDDNGSNSGSAYIFYNNNGTWTQQQKLLASDGATDDNFGRSVFISGNYALIGADLTDDSGSSSGSAYIFYNNGSSWTQQQKILASDGAAGDQFGFSVSISGDYAIIGATYDDDSGTSSGSAYIFYNNGSSWTEQQKIIAPDGGIYDRFGLSVSVSGDYVIVGSFGDDDEGSDAGAAYIFYNNGSNWTEQQKITASDAGATDWFGFSVSISGNYAIVGSYHEDESGSSSGSAYIFYNNGSSWTEQQKIIASDGAADDCFGKPVYISGDYVIAGAPGDDDLGATSGSAYIFYPTIDPTLTTQAVTNITANTATGNGNITDLGVPNPTAYGVCWNTSTAPLISDNATDEGAASSTGAFTSNITSLNANTTYYVRTYATNIAGTYYGNEVSFTSSAIAPTITTQAVTNITASTTTGNGNITDLGVPNPTAYGVCWNTSTAPLISDNATDKGATSSTGAFTSNISSLSENTTYYVRAYATNTAGTSYGNEVSFTTESEPTTGTGVYAEISGTGFEGVRNSSIAFADIDGDNDQDVLITGRNISDIPISKLYSNNGSGDYTVVAGTPFEGVRDGSVAFADMDGDDDLDILITGVNSSSGGTAKLYSNNGNGVFTEVSGTPFRVVVFSSIAFADIDGDNDQDVLITGWSTSYIAKLYTNNGTGTYTEVVGTPFDGVYRGSIAFADIDGDNDQDVLITGYNNSSIRIAKLYSNNGNGVFTEVSGTPFEGVQTSSIAFADVDGDNDQDVLITGYGSSNNKIAKLYSNNGSGTFTEVSGTPFEGVDFCSIAFADIDGDDDQDVLITGYNGTEKTAKLYTNNGAGVFAEVSKTPFAGVNASSIAFADVDGDHDYDVLITGKDITIPTAILYCNDVTTEWIGVDTDWTSTSNWSEGIPSAFHGVSIPTGLSNYPILLSTDSANCYDLTLEGTASLTIQSDADNSGSLIFGGSYTGGDITYQRHMLGGQWHMLGSPLSGQTINSSFLSTNSLSGMKHFTESPEAWSTDYADAAPGVDFVIGKGYATKRSTEGVIGLVGTPNNVTKSVELTRGDYGWNLLCNPFTSAIAATITGNDPDNLLTANADDLDPSFAALYLWVEDTDNPSSTNNYKTVNNSGSGTLVQNYLQVGQGFFVRAKEGGEDFYITPAMQGHQTAIAFKSDETSWARITLNAEISNAKASTNIAYHEGMTHGLDITYDGGLLNSYPGFALYTRLIEDNGVDFAIQCLPPEFEELVVPIGLDAKAGETVLFSANSVDLPEEYVVVLEDRESNIFTNLSEVDAKYILLLTSDSDGVGRFFIHTSFKSALGLADLETANIFHVFPRSMNNELIIRGEAKGNTTVRIYSITGKLLATENLQQLTENRIKFNENAGVYIVQISNKQCVFTQKIVWVK